MAQVGGRGGMRQMQARSQLEARVYQRFLEQSGREIGLSSDERSRLQSWLQDSQDQRRNLSDQAGAIRERLLRAVANPETSNAEFEQILGDLNNLRDREHDLWRRDQEQLAEMLPPRKRAQFVVRFLRLQDAVRDLIQQREGGGDDPITSDAGALDEETTPIMVKGGNPFVGGAGRAERNPPAAGATRVGTTRRPPVF
jgi:chromosome segregation ATPase